MLNVVCVLKQGGKVGYDASWVAKLQAMVSRNLTIPHRFVCLSDCAVSCEQLPLDNVGEGFWAKLQLFKPGLFTGPTLYLDLDTVICQNIDSIVERMQDQQFVMWYEADKDIHSSAIMWWQGDYSYLWNTYIERPNYWADLYRHPPLYGDQALISQHTRHELITNLVDPSWFHQTSKRDSEQDLSHVKILMFRKVHTKPSTLLGHQLVSAHWRI